MKLKTLKDMVVRLKAEATEEHAPRSGKPLLKINDQESFCNMFSYSVIYPEDLKQEAIKDIKAFRDFEKSEVDILWEKIIGRIIGEVLNYSEEAKEGIINYIKWKFNITEEDLK